MLVLTSELNSDKENRGINDGKPFYWGRTHWD